ncbi:hypothetical protein DPMN_041971 [Dreissena polymorpha]|uniref:Uncharacterized protein n=1 Tax=Dreissena polymorpha TaxID=45954 RepID=A0A9D4HWI5_DREPO|nr:hypothetical protein DPMN_041971 [Dreissena polymorpha]
MRKKPKASATVDKLSTDVRDDYEDDDAFFETKTQSVTERRTDRQTDSRLTYHKSDKISQIIKEKTSDNEMLGGLTDNGLTDNGLTDSATCTTICHPTRGIDIANTVHENKSNMKIECL